jgi:8-oxo-dGTP diphosphatase
MTSEGVGSGSGPASAGTTAVDSLVTRVHRLALGLFQRLPLTVRRLVVRAIAPKYSVGALCVIERADGRILLVGQTYRSRWGLPGGLLKRRESPAAAVRREVAEEVGLDVELRGEPTVVVESRLQRIDMIYRGVPAAGTDPDNLRVGTAEIATWAWFRPDQLPELQAETAAALVAMARNSVGDTAPAGYQPR